MLFNNNKIKTINKQSKNRKEKVKSRKKHKGMIYQMKNKKF